MALKTSSDIQVQSLFFDDILHSDKSVVLSAPTGSGKTVAYELAIVRLALQQLGTEAAASRQKAVYVAPIKTLCFEKYQEWVERFQPLGISSVQLTGDSDIVDLRKIHSAQLIITTPEKWEALTRNSWESDLLNDVRLFMIDEVHLLNDEERGPILEVIVARMKLLRTKDEAQVKLRFIVASATIPNIEDLASWIEEDPADVVQFKYGEQQRPVPLHTHVIGFNAKVNGFKFDMSLNYKIPGLIRRYSERKATLIFCNSRKSTEMAATAICKDTSLILLSAEKKDELFKISLKVSDLKLRKLVVHGIGFHHAGISSNDRSLVEESFRKGLIMVLFCTNTLAMGVNLPAHLVIIKSTDIYTCGSLKEYPESTLLQMMGRAGRPQYDASGTAVILTQSKNIQKYERLIHGGIVPIESNFHKHLAEHLNSEIALQTIKNLDMAMKWLRSTFLYVRAIKDPVHYKLQPDSDRNMVETFFEKICMMQINELLGAGLIVKDYARAEDVYATAYGKIMAKFYISLETMTFLQEIRESETLLDCINLISRCKEFSRFMLRVNEKQQLNALNKAVRFPINGRITRLEDKISCLIQAAFGNLQVNSPGLAEESLKVMRVGERLSMCLTECLCVSEKPSSNCFNFSCYKALLYSVMLSKCFHAKLWEHSEPISKQLPTNDAIYPTAADNDGKTTVKSISETEILNKSATSSFPEYLLEIKRAGNEISFYVNQRNRNYISNGSRVVLIVGDSLNNLLLFVDDVDNILLENDFLERTIILENDETDTIYAHVMHFTIVGVDTASSIVVKIPNTDEDFERLPTTQIQMNPFKGHPNSNAIIKINALPNIRKFCYSNPKIMKIHHMHNESESNSFDTKKRCEYRAMKMPRKKVVVQAQLTKYFKAKKCIQLKQKQNLPIARDTAIVDTKIQRSTAELFELKLQVEPNNTILGQSYSENKVTENCTQHSLPDEPLDLTVTKLKTTNFEFTPVESDLCSKKMPNLNVFNMYRKKEDFNNNMSRASMITTISINKANQLEPNPRAISCIEKAIPKPQVLSEIKKTVPFWSNPATILKDVAHTYNEPRQIERIGAKNQKIANENHSVQNVLNQEREVEIRRKTENAGKSANSINANNPFRLQIKTGTPETHTDHSNSTSSSKIRNINDDILKYVFNQKCTNLNDSYDWESMESLVLNPSDDAPILTAEQYKLIFQ